MSHDALCSYGPEWDRMRGRANGCPECDLIADVRADEKRRFEDVRPIAHKIPRATFTREALADLRAGVEALPDAAGRQGRAAGNRIWRRDVLALIDEATP